MKRRMPVWAMVIMDVLITGAALCVFSLFHHVIPRETVDTEDVVQIVNPYITPTPRPTEVPVPTATPDPNVTPDPNATPTPEPTPTPKVYEWTEKFKDYFSDTIIQTGNSYRSPTMAIEITTVEEMIDGAMVKYYVIDVRVASIQNFQTALANDSFGTGITQSILDMDIHNNAVFAITGDYYGYRTSGLVVRNGNLYRTVANNLDIGVLYYDGTLKTYSKGSYTLNNLVEKSPYQIWCFGPGLIDEDGNAIHSFSKSYGNVATNRNPRTGMGCVEPGHYIFMMVEGRSSWSSGVTMAQFADLFVRYGCTAAYNLDGGGSAMFTYNDKIMNYVSNGFRNLSDCIIFKEIE